MRWIVPMLACLAVPAAGAGGGLPEGAYRVAVHVAIPNVETRDYDFETEICWRGAHDPAMPLGPLGPGPLARCPSHARDTAEGVTVATTCKGPNAGFATASYTATPGGFSAHVAINLGGKNMTVAEIQRARRVGKCGD
jgi:hypothetical protein